MILSVRTDVTRLLIKYKLRPRIEMGNTYDSASTQKSNTSSAVPMENVEASIILGWECPSGSD